MNLGDQVRTKITGMTGRVATRANIVGVVFDNGEVALMDIDAVELVPPPAIAARKFKVRDYVTDGEEIFIVEEDDGDPEDEAPYFVVNIYDKTDSWWFSADDLELWAPDKGDRVVCDDDADNPGTVLAVVDDYATVLWDEFPMPQEWKLADLRPYEGDDDAPGFKKGNKVVYVRGVLAPGVTAEVRQDEVNGKVWVRFDRDHFKYAGHPDGLYSAHAFDHYHASAFSDAA